MPGHGRQSDGALVGEKRGDARDACDERDDGEARNHQAEPASRTLLLLQSQLLGLGQLLRLFQLALPGGFAGLLFGNARLLARLEKLDRRGETRAVTLGPGGVGPFGFPPRQRDPQLGVAIQPGFPPFVQVCAFRQSVVDASGLRFFLDPLPQPRPDAHQAFVRNVQDRLVGQLDLGRRHQERDAALPVGVDDRPQLVGRSLQDLTQTTQPLRTANSAAVRFLDRQCLKDPLAQGALVIAGQRLVDLISVQRQGQRHLADALVIIQIERVRVSLLRPDIPSPHQSVLQTGELIGLLTEIVQAAAAAAAARSVRRRP